MWIEAAQGSGDVGGNRRNWYVTAPPGVGSVVLPTDVGFAWPAPGSGDRISTPLVNEIHSTYWASYADVRQRATARPTAPVTP